MTLFGSGERLGILSSGLNETLAEQLSGFVPDLLRLIAICILI